MEKAHDEVRDESAAESAFDGTEVEFVKDSLSVEDLKLFGKPRECFGRAAYFSALGIGCYYAWLYLLCFAQSLFADYDMDTSWGTGLEVTSFLGYLAAIAVAVVAYRRMAWMGNRQVMATVAVTALCTAIQACAPVVFGFDESTVVVYVASFSAGAGSGFLLCRWAWLYVHHRDKMSLQFGCGLIISFVIIGVVQALPWAAQATCIVLLPVASGASIVRTTACSELEDERPRHELSSIFVVRWLPWRLTLGLCAMGLSYGISYQALFEHAMNSSLVLVVCLLVNVFVGALIVAYAMLTSKNYGFSSANMAVLPIAALGMSVALAYGVDGLPASFVLMRLAYVMFDAMLWLQMARVYERMGTVRAFLYSRLVLEGSVAIGVVAWYAIGVLCPDAHVLGRLVALAFLLFALTVAFQGESIGTVWNLFTKSTVRTGKFRRACARMTEEFHLTPRESEIMGLVLRGRNGTYITEQLVISKSTYQTHMRNLYRKLDVHSNQELLNLLELYLAKGKEEESSLP